MHAAFWTVPSDSTSLSGSTPGERMKKIGEEGPLSLKDFANSVFRPSVYFTPSFSSTKFLESGYIDINEWTNTAFNSPYMEIHLKNRKDKNTVKQAGKQILITLEHRSYGQASGLSSWSVSAVSFFPSTPEETSPSQDTLTPPASSSAWVNLQYPDPDHETHQWNS